jgi:hypothetical protein
MQTEQLGNAVLSLTSAVQWREVVKRCVMFLMIGIRPRINIFVP